MSLLRKGVLNQVSGGTSWYLCLVSVPISMYPVHIQDLQRHYNKMQVAILGGRCTYEAHTGVRPGSK